MKKVAVIGGGTGIFPVTSALKHLPVDVSTIVAVSDSGGSTGRIRDEFGFQPVGDLRQSLAALAEDEGQEWIRKLLLYRFEKGTGLKGHNLGNLILTALQDLTGTTSEALYRAQQIFRLEGTVIPATEQVVDLKIEFTDGSTVIGEDTLDRDTDSPMPIKKVSLVPAAPINPYAQEAIAEADYVIIGPGDFYASLMAALAPQGTAQAFAKSQAKIVYIMNLMTRRTQTAHMTAHNHVLEIERHLKKPVDLVIMNAGQIPKSILKRYAAEHEYPVTDDLEDDSRVVRADIISDAVYQASQSDTAHRSLLRHDSTKLQQVLKRILK
ncbi:MAG TPA: gluconeogenesis factor YvcK family protein [Patescibacteria group bacterium]